MRVVVAYASYGHHMRVVVACTMYRHHMHVVVACANYHHRVWWLPARPIATACVWWLGDPALSMQRSHTSPRLADLWHFSHLFFLPPAGGEAQHCLCQKKKTAVAVCLFSKRV